MIEQLEKINKIYDLMALCSSYIFNEERENPYEFALFNNDDYEYVYGAINTYCCEKEQKGCYKAFNELKENLIEYLKREITVEKCYAIVIYIDELVEVEINYKLFESSNIIKYCSLNEQYLDSVKIIPKVKETFLKYGDNLFKANSNSEFSLFREVRKCPCSLLDKETNNYMIWNRDYIKKYPTCIYHINQMNPIFKHFYERKQVVFGIVPFTNKQIDEILKIGYKENAFFVEAMYREAEDELKKRYMSIFDRCKKQDIDFLIFPEMLMTDDIINSIREETGTDGPRIIVNGSIWKDKTNKSIVTDGKGKEIFSYCKKEPFILKKKEKEYKEWLDKSKNREYSILEIEGIGRIGVGICKDLLNEEIRIFHKFIGTDILIIPSYTKSFDLQSAAEELSQDYQCVVVIANACSALEDMNVKGRGSVIGFISFPAKCNGERSKIVNKYTKKNCVEDCDCQCTGKKISLDISKINDIDSKFYYDVRELPF